MFSAFSPAALPRDSLPAAPSRDLRLDWFRGLLQLFILISHMPGNWFILAIHRSYGFSDSSELFVLLSGYGLGSVQARLARRAPGWRGDWLAARDLIGRTIRLYRNHLVLFAIVSAIGLGLLHLSGPALLRGSWFDLPGLAAGPRHWLAEALLLAYQPALLDILPLFMLLMLALPVFSAAADRFGAAALAPSAALWLLVQLTGINLPLWAPEPVWAFNPLAWQFLFFLGVMAGRARLGGQRVLPRRGSSAERLLLGAAVALVLFALPVRLAWSLSEFWPDFPTWDALWPLDKQNLPIWRLAHALALAALVARFVPAGHPGFAHRWAQPLIRCGRHSLTIFCIGVPLGLSGLVALNAAGGAWPAQIAVTAIGLGGLIAAGWWLDRPKPARPQFRRSPFRRPQLHQHQLHQKDLTTPGSSAYEPVSARQV